MTGPLTNVEISRATIQAFRDILPAVVAWEPHMHPNVQAGSDYAIITQRYTIAHRDKPAYDVFLERMKADPFFGAFEKQLAARISFGGAGYIGTNSIITAVLAEYLQKPAGADMAAHLADFKRRVDANVRRERMVTSLMGIEVAAAIDLGGGLVLEPLSGIPPSTQRGMALDQPHPITIGYRGPIAPKPTAALWIRYDVEPAFAPMNEVNLLMPGDGRDVAEVQILFDEAVSCLSTIVRGPVLRQLTWAQPEGPDALPSFAGAWQTSDEAYYKHIAAIGPPDPAAVADFCQKYFAQAPKARRAKYHVAMARLNKAMWQRFPVDKAIDLGIALEALLLHDISQKSELAFRVRLRGALLHGGTLEERRETKKLLGWLYDLRSKAVHDGHFDNFDGPKNTTELLAKGCAECALLIEKLVRNPVNFPDLELGTPDL